MNTFTIILHVPAKEVGDLLAYARTREIKVDACDLVPPKHRKPSGKTMEGSCIDFVFRYLHTHGRSRTSTITAAAEEAGFSKSGVYGALNNLKHRGKVRRAGPGIWEPTKGDKS